MPAPDRPRRGKAPAQAPGAASPGQGAGDPAAVVPEAAEAGEEAAGSDVADEESCASLEESAVSEDGSEESEDGQQGPAAAPAAASAGKGGRGRGRGRGRAGGGGGGRAGGRGGAKAPTGADKWKWVDVDKHTFKERAAWEGEDRPTLGEDLAHLKWTDDPVAWFKPFDAPDSEYELRATNSEKYRSFRHGRDMDGVGKRSYGDACKIEVADMRMQDAFILLSGLDPAISRAAIFQGNRLAIIGHRGAELLNEDRMQMLRKFHHPSDPFAKKEKGQPGYDNLHQVSPMLKSFSQTCRSPKLVKGGKDKAGDEQTLGNQAAAADQLKQNCGKYKAAGDGLQADAVCYAGGSLGAFAFRGHSLLPKVSVKGRPEIKLCETTARTLWVFYLAGVQKGSRFGLDNLYNSVELASMLEMGTTLEFEIPKGWTADVEFKGDESAKKIEWKVEPMHVVGTLRGNRGSEKAHQWPAKMTKATCDALKLKPLLPDRVKARVTADDAQVMTVGIFEKGQKGFQMIDTVHSSVELEQKPRRVFDKATGRPAKKMVDITNTQNLYNKIMGYVDLDDLLAWYYRSNAYRERKYWWPVYIWIIRKRVDKAYQARLISFQKAIADTQRKLADQRLGADRKAALEKELKEMVRNRPKHFEHIEACAGYHIVKAYNSSRPAAQHLTDWKQWRQALAPGPLTNAKRGGKSKKKRTASDGGATAPSPAASSSAADETPKKKIIRGTMYSKTPDGDIAWPPSRLVGKHPIGWHETGSRNTNCDYPGCCDLEKTSSRKSPAADAAAMPPPAPRFSNTSSRAPSPTPSDASSTTSLASTRGGATKLFCKCCYDASNSRPMNFHAECYNAWHGLCQEAGNA